MRATIGGQNTEGCKN